MQNYLLRNFYEKFFVRDPENSSLAVSSDDHQEIYVSLFNTFSKVVPKNTRIKKKVHTSFMNKGHCFAGHC